MFNKRAEGNTFWIIISAVIALVVVILIIMWFSKGGGKAFGEVETRIESLGDCDDDGAANMFDKCPCDLNIGSEWTEETKETKQCPRSCTEQEKKDCETCGKLSCP